MKIIRVEVGEGTMTCGNWDGAKDLFPTFKINQNTGVVNITYYSADDKKGRGCTWEHVENISEDGQALLVTGMCGHKNFRNPECSGRQNFVFAVFVGDSGHIYIHRAPATKGWLNCEPSKITKRLRKLGIGADKGVIQQGDFLLKPANGSAYPDDLFRHESMGAGHHNFEMPVLYATGDTGRQYKVTEPTLLIHSATDGIKHPDIIVPIGIWIVGTTASQLYHSNICD